MMIEIWIDGSCSPNPGIGGWAFVIPDSEIEVSGGEPDTTNQRMELTAAIRALEVTKIATTVSIISDSRYVVDCFRQGWWKKWERNGWKNATKQPVANRDLWTQLIALVLVRDVTFWHVKGHTGAVHNERAHDLASASVEVLCSLQAVDRKTESLERGRQKPQKRTIIRVSSIGGTNKWEQLK